jgi:hypothetical protein
MLDRDDFADCSGCMRTLILALVLATLGGCAASSYQGSPAAFSRAAECARNGGIWHEGTGAYAYCEIRS